MYDIINKYPHHYLILPDANEQWFDKHVTTLMRTLENHGQNCAAAYSGRIIIAGGGNRSREKVECIHWRELYEGLEPACSGQILMRAEIENLIPEATYRSLDGWEKFALLLRAKFAKKQDIVYSMRSTLAYDPLMQAEKHLIISADKQLRLIKGLVMYQYDAWKKSSFDTFLSPLNQNLGANPRSVQLEKNKLYFKKNLYSLLMLFSGKKKRDHYRKLKKQIKAELKKLRSCEF